MLTLALLLFQEKDPATTKEAMQRVQLVVGPWRCTVVNKESKEESWVEKQEWNFKIEKDEFRLEVKITDGKYLKGGVLGYDLKKKVYRFEAARADGRKSGFEGKLKDRELLLEEIVEKGTAQDRMTFHLLRDNRFLVSVERRAAGKETYLLLYAYGCTKEGVPFVKGEPPKCVVTGGTGTMPVSYEGKTYYVC